MVIKLGVVGLSKNGGWAAMDLIPPLFEKPLSDRFALTAVSTSSAASASASATHYSERAGREVKAYHGATDAISADPDVDLVVVSVKTPAHAAAAAPAIKAGKDIFVEWPLGTNLDEAKSLARAAEQAGVRTMIGLQYWSAPGYIKAKEWVEAGKIGRVLAANWYGVKDPELPIGSPWVLSSYEYITDPKNGATFLDIPVAHAFSAITHILGPLRTVSATTTVSYKETIIASAPGASDARTIPNEIPDQFAISGVFASGALFSGLWMELGKARPAGEPATVLEIVGTEGRIRVEADAVVLAQPSSISLNEQKIDLAEENTAKGWTARAWEAFGNREEGAYATFKDAVDLHRLIAAVRKSDSEGRRVNVDEV